jgi:hypothetical protein
MLVRKIESFKFNQSWTALTPVPFFAEMGESLVVGRPQACLIPLSVPSRFAQKADHPLPADAVEKVGLRLG